MISPVWPSGVEFANELRIAVCPWPAATYSAHFEPFHYLDGPLSRVARAWLVYVPTTMAPVAFDATIPFKGAGGLGKWQESRLVVLPHFRGRGIGIALSEWVGEYHRSRGERMYSTTRNKRLGQARDRSARWRPTRWNGVARAVEHPHALPGHSDVIRYCHEYVGLTAAEQPP